MRAVVVRFVDADGELVEAIEDEDEDAMTELLLMVTGFSALLGGFLGFVVGYGVGFKEGHARRSAAGGGLTEP